MLDAWQYAMTPSKAICGSDAMMCADSMVTLGFNVHRCRSWTSATPGTCKHLLQLQLSEEGQLWVML